MDLTEEQKSPQDQLRAYLKWLVDEGIKPWETTPEQEKHLQDLAAACWKQEAANEAERRLSARHGFDPQRARELSLLPTAYEQRSEGQ